MKWKTLPWRGSNGKNDSSKVTGHSIYHELPQWKQTSCQYLFLEWLYRYLPYIVHNKNRPIRHHWKEWWVIVRNDLHIFDPNLILRTWVQNWREQKKTRVIRPITCLHCHFLIWLIFPRYYNNDATVWCFVSLYWSLLFNILCDN